METKEFTIADGINIQTKQLKVWKSKLLPHVYKALEKEALRKNDIAKNGYGVFRGDDMTIFIKNYPLNKS